jgi:hypothetical protein
MAMTNSLECLWEGEGRLSLIYMYPLVCALKAVDPRIHRLVPCSDQALTKAPRDRNISAVHPIAPDSLSHLFPYPLPFCVAETEAGSVVVGDFVPHGNARHSGARFFAEKPPQQDQLRQAFLFYRPHPSFRVRVQLRTPCRQRGPSAHRFQRVVERTRRISHLGHAIDICACAENPTPPQSRSGPAVPSTPDPDAA